MKCLKELLKKRWRHPRDEEDNTPVNGTRGRLSQPRSVDQVLGPEFHQESTVTTNYTRDNNISYGHCLFPGIPLKRWK